ncbi:MAG: hypothetical protein WDZ35_04840 [Crocinitomicaceae bacterium]
MQKPTFISAVVILFFLISACQSKSNESANSANETNSSTASGGEEDVEQTNKSNADKDARLDSTAIINEIESLSTIEQLAIFNPYSQTYDFELYGSLLKHKKQEKRFQELSSEITNVTGYFNLVEFIKVDPKNGYIQYAQAESIQTIVYWNKSDGTKLVAREITGCGPVCESSIRFMISEDGSTTTLLEKIDYQGMREFKNGDFNEYSRYSDNVSSQIIPQIRELPYKIVSGYDENDFDPIEFTFVLPQKGKNIQFCLEDDCVELVWKDGVFLLDNESEQK